ncbi:hypothetical protein MMC06_003231 [Schaereria dolodes]|nr:hypothetical protein [Schaereria dolodes]
MPSTTTDPTAKSGIITSETGERHIPSSVRSDGTERKAIRIRPGYRPPEDVEVYKNRTAEAWKTRGTGGIPGALGLESDTQNSDEKASGKNAKRREARKKAKAMEEGNPRNGERDENLNGDFQRGESPGHFPAKIEDWRTPALETEVDPEVEKEKQARNLKKKLRQARELREKKDQGESLLPEQFEKVIKINELIRQLNSLGLDAEGEPKTADGKS